MVRRLELITMSALLLSILGISMGIPHCPMWKEIAPCTCRMDSTQLTSIYCEKMSSYEQVITIFRGHFSPSDRVSLKLAYSSLDDLRGRSFKELNMSIENLKLNHDNLRILDGNSFEGLNSVLYLSLADNILDRVPEELWKKMPNLKTIDLGRTRIPSLSGKSFQNLPHLQVLVLPGNMISRMESNSIPSIVHRLHLGRNMIRDLNGTLLNLSELIWLFVNTNELTTLENQLPINAHKLKMIHASNNRIEKLPQHLKTLTSLESLFVQHNLITSLDGALSKSRKLKRVVLDHNKINLLTPNEFIETESLESLILSHNHITSLNNSLLTLRNLNFLNLTYNLLTEFSFEDIIGLQELRSLDLSHNKISNIIGPTSNLIEWDIKLAELKLDYNLLESLNGALSGLPKLLRLNLSFNKLTRISPDDLIGLDQLRLLDVSNNHLTTLEETSKTFLPRLEELRASHNYLTILDRDFHGLPVLCYADLSNNQIVALGRDLVSKTRCKIGHGVHEGTWDTLKIYLQDNPILCDAALPEIMSAMEINHTRIYGVAHCAPLSEQPVTTKPNGFLGYIPETTPSLPAAISANIPSYKPPENVNQPVQLKPLYKQTAYQPLPLSVQQQKTQSEAENTNKDVPYQDSNVKTQENFAPVENKHVNFELVDQQHKTQVNHPDDIQDIKNTQTDGNLIQDNSKKPLLEEPILNEDLPKQSLDDHILVGQIVRQQSLREENTDEQMLHDQPARTVVDPLLQEQQLNRLATEIQILQRKVEELATQNQLLTQNLNQQLMLNSNQSDSIGNKQENVVTDKSYLYVSTTEKPPNENSLREP